MVPPLFIRTSLGGPRRADGAAPSLSRATRRSLLSPAAVRYAACEMYSHRVSLTSRTTRRLSGKAYTAYLFSLKRFLPQAHLRVACTAVQPQGRLSLVYGRPIGPLHTITIPYCVDPCQTHKKFFRKSSVASPIPGFDVVGLVVVQHRDVLALSRQKRLCLTAYQSQQKVMPSKAFALGCCMTATIKVMSGHCRS